jgi:hypothetical protein
MNLLQMENGNLRFVARIEGNFLAALSSVSNLDMKIEFVISHVHTNSTG